MSRPTWTQEDRDTRPEGCHLCGTEGVPLTNYSTNYGGYQGPHWLCGLCENTQAGSRLGATGRREDWMLAVADLAAMLHANNERTET